MKKIMFNDRYGLTEAVIEGRKTVTRRIMNNQSGYLTGHIRFTKKGSDLLYVKADFDNGTSEVAPYAIGEIVALAQSYNKIYDLDAIRELDGGFVKLSDCAGWNNKMFVSAELMLHQIRITNIRAELLQDISDKDCFKEGIRHIPEIGKFYFEDVRREEGFYFNDHR